MRSYPDVSGPAVLATLRSKPSMHFQELCMTLGLQPRSLTIQGVLIRTLEDLRQVGLISADRENLGEWESDATFEVTPLLGRISRILNLSITSLAARIPGKSLTVNPFFGLPKKRDVDQFADIFVLMPFHQEVAPVYQDHIVRVAKKLGCTINRGDDFFTSHEIIVDIWSAICAAKVCIAECTGRNPNVFYEIGIAHVIGIPVVLITQDKEDVPFDLRHLRFIHYSFTPRGMKAFEDELLETLGGYFL